MRQLAAGQVFSPLRRNFELKEYLIDKAEYLLNNSIHGIIRCRKTRTWSCFALGFNGLRQHPAVLFCTAGLCREHAPPESSDLIRTFLTGAAQAGTAMGRDNAGRAKIFRRTGIGRHFRSQNQFRPGIMQFRRAYYVYMLAGPTWRAQTAGALSSLSVGAHEIFILIKVLHKQC